MLLKVDILWCTENFSEQKKVKKLTMLDVVHRNNVSIDNLTESEAEFGVVQEDF